ncbi:MAG: M20/M25/M40 family metallo-hydrolase [bacterium]|nr:M20/M25/M40 family metallo-hydrolase [bacterium]
MSPNIDETIYQRPTELLQHLIRFDTSNPPGNEKECIEYIHLLLKVNGIEATILSKDPNRPNLIARLKGEDESPLMLYGHIDVVQANPADWKYPPFEGKIADGFIWGRGALDMKGAVAMMLCAFIKAKKENTKLPGDVVLCIVSDEEELGDYGARFLVEEHPELFKGIHYALGEFGAFSLYTGGKKFYPIEIAQKQKCGIKATINGPAGHGSAFTRGGTMAKLAQMLDQLDKNHLPVHITPAAEKMFTAMANNLPFPTGTILRQLLKPGRTDFILKILGEKGNVFVPMFHNTVNATVVRGGDKINVIPDKIEVEMDVRILPGFTPDDVIKELHTIIGDDIQLEVILYDAGPDEPDMGLFEKLANILKEADPEGIPVPLLLTGSTDGRFFSGLGIQTYGFIPMQLPEEMNFNRTIHAADERIPVETLSFGTDALFRAIQR